MSSDDGAPGLTGTGRLHRDGAGRRAGAGTAVIEVSHLTKDFGGRTAVADVSFSVTSGEVTALEQMLAHFQAAGQFRPDFNPQVMALAIRGAIDQVPPRLARDPDLDVDGYARELAASFDLATRGGPERPGG